MNRRGRMVKSQQHQEEEAVGGRKLGQLDHSRSFHVEHVIVTGWLPL